jgi:hypothetical protein
MLKVRSAAIIVATITAVAGGVMAAAPAGAAPRAGASWHITESVKGANYPSFSAGAAASATSAWAFLVYDANVNPAAYQLSGKSWHKESFPGQRGERVVAASDPASSDVWAFTQSGSSFGGRALQFNGHSWKSVKTFSEPISSGLALASNDVWVFGTSFPPELGNIHYNGHTWANTHGPLLQGASALSAKNIWGYGTSDVAHWNGSKWKATSVSKLLPKGNEVCGPGVLDGIYAASGSNVVATAASGCPDGGGATIVLHYNGSSWSKVANKFFGDALTVIGDGSGGAWVACEAGAPPTSFILHYSRGKLTKVSEPGKYIDFFAAAIGQHTTAALIFGTQSNALLNPTKSNAVVLEYES